MYLSTMNDEYSFDAHQVESHSRQDIDPDLTSESAPVRHGLLGYRTIVRQLIELPRAS